jgi:hypothetical protein
MHVSFEKLNRLTEAANSLHGADRAFGSELSCWYPFFLLLQYYRCLEMIQVKCVRLVREQQRQQLCLEMIPFGFGHALLNTKRAS